MPPGNNTEITLQTTNDGKNSSSLLFCKQLNVYVSHAGVQNNRIWYSGVWSIL